ncbi:MAG TPA: ABC transporter permease [Vicinamibacterales bacterium]|nr:ABC transporter permease [Vicinamibacterales bacterium]
MRDDRPPPHQIDDEIAFHIEMQTRRYVAAGLDPHAARERALRRMGDIDRARNACTLISLAKETDMERTAWSQGLRQDAVYAWRVLRKTPAFTATVLLTIAMGIGATTAIFSVVNTVLLRGAPYPNADRVAVVWNSYAATGLSEAAVAAAEFADIRDTSKAFDAVAALRPQTTSLSGACGSGPGCEPERVTSYVVSPNLFDLLGVTPSHGRPFAAADGVTGAPQVVLLSDALWQRRFGADPSIVGQTITVGAVSRTVVGVMPAGARFPDAPVGFLRTPADLWIPYGWEQSRKDSRGNQMLGMLARRRAGVSIEQASADLDAIAAGFRQQYANRYARPDVQWRLKAVPINDQIVGDVRTSLIVLLGAVGVVLLITCANVANLMLARGTARRRELAVRSALGAGRGRLVRQLLIEAAMLVTAGGVLGIGLALAGVRGLIALDAGNIPLLDHAGIDVTVLGFAIAVTVLTGLLVGLAPALRQSTADPQIALGGAERTAGDGSIRHRLRRVLVVGEVTMAVVVLVAAGLLVRSFARMAATPIGFDPDGTVVAQIALPRAQYNDGGKILAFQRELLDRFRALPGTAGASAVFPLPMSGDGWGGTVIVENQPAGLPEPHAEYAVAMPGYFSTLRIPVVDGREFADSDVTGTMLVAVVDEEFARQYWPGESAVGKRISPFGPLPANDPRWTTVVGVVGHVRNGGPRKAGEGQLYLPALQKPELTLYFVVRATGSDQPLPAAIRQTVRSLDSQLPIGRLSATRALVGRLLARERFNMLLLSIFGGVALTIAAVGLYGLLAFLVTQRTREIGIRLALGGRPGRILRTVIGEGLALSSLGLVLGCASALLAAPALRGLLFGIEPTDPLTYAGIAGVLLVVAAAASYLPARRATRIDPVSVLRN